MNMESILLRRAHYGVSGDGLLDGLVKFMARLMEDFING